MNAQSDVAGVYDTDRADADLELLFRNQYGRIVRVLARLVRDPARAEELGVELFLRLWRNKRTQAAEVESSLYYAAIRTGLNELRSQIRRSRYERLADWVRGTPTPEQISVLEQQRHRVRMVLRTLAERQTALLLLRSEGLSYEEIATALNLQATSVGTLLSRTQTAFRKEYVKRYGEQRED